ncbi:MAG: DUF1844 domain-containing protein [Myxococcales bacterium]|nr:DUF1844 domain-containing protein [Myxococcales bacterium]
MSEDRELPISFSSFIGSLFGSAMVNLGEAEDPMTRKKSVDLMLARNTIDLLGVLKEKTKGNLDDEEGRLLDSVLYECRTKFIEKSRG